MNSAYHMVWVEINQRTGLFIIIHGFLSFQEIIVCYHVGGIYMLATEGNMEIHQFNLALVTNM